MGLIDVLWNAITRSQDRSRDRHADLEVNIKNGFFTYGPDVGEPMVVATAVNRCRHPIRVTSVAFQTDSMQGKWGWDVHPHPVSTLPGVIQPLDSGQAFLLASQMKQVGVDLTKRFTVGVKLGDDTMIWAKPRVLWKEDLLAA